MTIEEKAKRYDEVLGRARELLDYGLKDTRDKRVVLSFFPELKEVEDERIRKELIGFLRNIPNSNYTCEEMALWLEKQGDNNNEDADILQRFSFYSYKDEPNVLYLSNVFVNEEYRNKGIGTKILKIADEVSTYLKCNSIRLKTENGSNAESLYRKNGYKTLKEEGNQVWLEKQGEQKTSVVDFKAKDWYVSKVDGKIYNAKFMEKTPTNQARKLEIEKAAMSATGIIKQEEWFIKGAEWSDKNPSYICSEKQNEQKPTDEEMKELLRTEYEKGRADTIAEMKSSWSEEDEKILNNLIDHIKVDDALQYSEKQVVDWLESIKQRIGG